MYTIRAYYLQYCGSYALHRRRQTPDDGRWMPDDGPPVEGGGETCQVSHKDTHALFQKLIQLTFLALLWGSYLRYHVA